MADEKKSRVRNPYAGLSLEELQSKAESAKYMIKANENRIIMCHKEIDKQNAEITKAQVEIDNYRKVLARINDAKKYVGSIETVRIIVVYKDTVCIDKNPNRTYSYNAYYPSMTKDLVLYNFAVMDANKADYNKANSTIIDSCTNHTLKIKDVYGTDKYGYLADNRKKLQEDIVKAIRTFGVVDVIFNDDVTVGKALIEKELGHKVIVR